MRRAMSFSGSISRALASQSMGLLVVAVSQRAARQPDHGDGVAGIQLDHPLVDVPGPDDLVDLQVSVGLEDLLDHVAEPT